MNIGMAVSNIVAEKIRFCQPKFLQKIGSLCIKKLGGWETSEKGKKVRRPPNKSGDMESLIEPPPPPPTHTHLVCGRLVMPLLMGGSLSFSRHALIGLGGPCIYSAHCINQKTTPKAVRLFFSHSRSQN